MKKPQIQQKTERRISAALRLVLVAVLLVVQIAVVFVLSYLLEHRMALAYMALELVALAYTLRIWCRSGSSSYKFGWVLLILTVPVVGLILYWLWSGDHVSKQLALKKREYPASSAEQLRESSEALTRLQEAEPEWHRLPAYLERRGFALYGGTQAAYLPTGAAYLDDMCSRMEEAKRFIFMEYYIVTRGAVFDRLVEIFRRKCAQGVEVKLIFDDFGSMMRLGVEEVEALRAMGVEVQIFNPVHQYVNRLYFNYRDHRKITCIDGDIAYTGGANIADEYAGIIERFGYWKDCGVRLTGAGAWGLTREFINMWQRMDGTLAHEDDYYHPQQAVEGEGYCQPFVDGPDNNPINTAEDVFMALIGSARRTLTITTPYLAIDEPVMRALCMAGDSGVDVRMIMPGTPDHKFAYLVAESYFGELISHGIRVYCFTPGFLHGKAVLADGETAFVGSVNMDYRSFELHFECGTVLYGTQAGGQLQRDMEEIIAASECVTMESWACRPWYRKAAARVLRLFAMWM